MVGSPTEKKSLLNLIKIREKWNRGPKQMFQSMFTMLNTISLPVMRPVLCFN